jgi:hypothetical protein
VYVGAVLAVMLACVLLAAGLASGQVFLARWVGDRTRDAQAYYAALTGLERLKPLCPEVMDPRAAAPGDAFEVPGAAGAVGPDASVERVVLTYTCVSGNLVEAEALSVGASGSARAAVRARLRAEWAEGTSGELVLAGASFAGPVLRVPVP